MGPGFTLITDFDDTLKISHTTNHLRTVIRGLFMHQAYAGMAELYQEWLGDREYVVMSSSPNVIRGKIDHFLKRHRFPSRRQIWLRDWIKQPDIRRYKTDNLKRILRDLPPPYIFIGDDAEWDPEVFHRFKQENPDRVAAIYIRRMRGRPLPEGVTPYHTAFDIAYAEYQASRLTVPQVARVVKTILEQKNPDLIIPYFAVAPNGLPSEVHPSLQSLHNALHERLVEIYDHRESED